MVISDTYTLTEDYQTYDEKVERNLVLLSRETSEFDEENTNGLSQIK